MTSSVFSAAEFLLRDFTERRGRNPKFSLRAYAKKVGIPSGRLSEYMRGKRRLTVDVAKRISKALSLAPKKNAAFSALARLESKEGVQRLELGTGPSALAKLRGTWRLRETTADLGFDFDFEIRAHPIRPNEIEIFYLQKGEAPRKNLSSVSEGFETSGKDIHKMMITCEPRRFDDRLVIASIYLSLPPDGPLIASALSEIALLTDGRLFYRREAITSALDEGCFLTGSYRFDAFFERE